MNSSHLLAITFLLAAPHMHAMEKMDIEKPNTRKMLSKLHIHEKPKEDNFGSPPNAYEAAKALRSSICPCRSIQR